MTEENAFNQVMNIITEVVIIIGLIGHVITFIVFSRSTFRKNSIGIYCRTLAIFDSNILSHAVMNLIIIINGYSAAFSSDIACKLYAYVMYALGSMPGWILIAFSVDKLFSLRRVTGTMKRPIIHYSIITAIVLIHLTLYIVIPIYLRPVVIPGYGVLCDVSTLSFGETLNIVYMAESSIIPFVIMFITSIITIKLLWKSRRQMKTAVNLGNQQNKRKSRDAMFALTSLTFNILFIVLKMPLLVCLTIGFEFINGYVLEFSILFYILNLSIGVFVHFVSNSLFRRELFILFRIRKVDQSEANYKKVILNKRKKIYLFFIIFIMNKIMKNVNS